MYFTAVHAEDVVSCVQALLELGSMIAPRTQLDLRLKGFALEVCHNQLGECMPPLCRTACNTSAAQ